MNPKQIFAAELFDACAPLVTDPDAVLHFGDLDEVTARRYLLIATRLRDHLSQVQIPALIGLAARGTETVRPWMTTSEAADVLGVSPNTVWRWAKMGTIPCDAIRKAGKHSRISRAWCEQRRVAQ